MAGITVISVRSLKGFGMNKYLKRLLPLFCFILFIIESYTLYSIVAALKISETNPWFIFIYFIIVGPTISAVFWTLGSLIKKRSETICRLLHLIPVYACIIGFVMVVVNLIHPYF